VDALHALPSARIRELPLFADQRLRDTTLAFYAGFVAPALSAEQRHAWLQAERRLALLFLPVAAAPARVPTLHQWLVTAGEMMEGAPSLETPMADHFLCAADHALALAAAVPSPAPPVPENLVALVAQLRSGPRFSVAYSPPPTTGKPQGPRLVHDGDAPDLEDLLAHAPPCLRKMLDAPHQKDQMRQVLPHILVGVGFRTPSDVPRITAFVNKDGKGDSKHVFSGKLAEAMQQGGRWERNCKTIHADKQLPHECGGGLSLCPYAGQGDDCRAVAGFEEGSIRRPSDYVHLSRRRKAAAERR
jgi:hypothetical protein